MSPQPAGTPFEVLIQVQASDIDQLGHVNNIVYLRWVQEAAVAHWNALTTPAQRANLAWVVTRHEIDYKRPARAGDGVIARTWVGNATTRAFERHTEILRQSDRRILARARTVWCPIDPASGRPRQVAPDVRALVSVLAGDGQSAI